MGTGMRMRLRLIKNEYCDVDLVRAVVLNDENKEQVYIYSPGSQIWPCLVVLLVGLQVCLTWRAVERDITVDNFRLNTTSSLPTSCSGF